MIRRIQICNFGSIREEITIECGQLTLIRGENASGKSMILHAIALALTPHGPLPRSWCRDTDNRARVRIELTNSYLGDLTVDRYFRISVDPCRFRESVTVVNGQERHDVTFLQNLVQVVFFQAFRTEDGRKKDREFLRNCSRLLGLGGHVEGEALKHIAAVFEQVNRRSERSFREVILQKGGLWLQHWDKEEHFPLVTAGGGDFANLSSDFALEVAAAIGGYRDVLFLLDDFPTKISPIERFARRYRQMSIPGVQAVMTTTYREQVSDALIPDVLIDLEDPCLGHQVLNGSPNADFGTRSYATRITNVTRAARPEIALIERAIRRFDEGQEDCFTENLVVPMLTLLRFSGVRRNAHHGTGELGFDVGPASRELLPGRTVFFGFQVKAGRVHARSSASGSVTELISQVRKMLSARVLEPVNQTTIRADFSVAIVSKHLTDEAKRLWDSEFADERRVLLWDAPTLAGLIFEAGIWPRLPISSRACATTSTPT